jgi:hypothetical protein
MGWEEAVAGLAKAVLDKIEYWVAPGHEVPKDVWNRGRATVEEIRATARHVDDSPQAGVPPREVLESVPSREVLRRWVDQLEELSNRLPTNMRRRIRLDTLVVMLGSLPVILMHSAVMSEQAVEGKARDETIEEMRVWFEFYRDAFDYDYKAPPIDLSAVEPDTPPLPGQPAAPQEQSKIRTMLLGMNREAARAVVESATRVLSDMDNIRRTRRSREP